MTKIGHEAKITQLQKKRKPMPDQFKTIIEPFRMKMIEPLTFHNRRERATLLENAHFNLFQLKAEDVLIDLLTDSGTSAMSSAQWGRIMEGDESYAGCKSFYVFEEVVKDLTGYQYVFPTHQGRASERILFSILGGNKKSIPNNTHFDTTRANIEFTGTKAVDLLIQEGNDPESEHPFKGNMDLLKLEEFISTVGPQNIPICMVTITNNSGGGQPVSLENIRSVSKICKNFKIPFFLDACRFAENSYFIKIREKGQSHRSVKEIAQEIFSLADGCLFSAKKDAFVNMGGFLAFNDSNLAEKVKNLEILTEGFPTYGGLAGRDLEAIAQGLKEIVDEHYLKYRITSTKYLGESLIKAGIPLLTPIGGHAVYINARKFLPHIPLNQFPGHALACALYLEGGIRTCEIGSLMFGKKDLNGNEIPHVMDLVRLAIPRRVYTQAHIDFVVEVLTYVFKHREEIKGIKIISEPNYLRHFSAKMSEV